MSLQLIKSNPTFTKPHPAQPHLDIAEFFCDTIQGENYVGWPAAFLRLQHCTLACTWCDTQEVWHYGNPYTFEELFDLMDQADLPRKLRDGQRLVLTGGSPLKQQEQLYQFITKFVHMYDFKPYIEIENECTLPPFGYFSKYIDCWNNSPKLQNSGNLEVARIQPAILKTLSSFDNSWFKFVVTGKQAEWDEIERDFLVPGYIKREQIVLMPLGATRDELNHYRGKVIDMAISHNVRYSTREHVVVWDMKTGV